MKPKDIIKSYLNGKIDYDTLVSQIDSCEATETQESFRIFHKAVNLINAFNRAFYTKGQFDEILLDLISDGRG